MKNKLACAFALLIIALPIAAQSDPGARIIASADLQADLAILRSAYEQLHPGLYRYNTKVQMDANFDELGREFSRDRTLRDTFVALSRFAAKVKCGHTYTNFYNQSGGITTDLFKGQNRVPFYFRWLERTMIVTRNFSSDARLVPGSKIISINGRPAGTILSTLMSVARADGANDAKRVADLEVNGASSWEAFDIYFPMLFPAESRTMELSVIFPGKSKPAKVTVAALTDDQRKTNRAASTADDKKDAPAFTFKQIDAKTGLLTMPTWALYNSKWDWKKFIDQTFDTLIDQKIPNLILDIRVNEGGQDVGEYIISRLIARDTTSSKYRRLLRYQKAPTDLRPYLDTWDRSFDDWTKYATEKDGDFYVLKRPGEDKDGDIIRPSGRRYTGRVFVLVSPVNSSATFQFAQTMKENKLATLVGQPTGGNQRGITGGAFYFLQLPKTKLEIDLPLIGRFPITDMPDAGIEPDIYVRPRAADIARGRDPEIAAVTKLIRR